MSSAQILEFWFGETATSAEALGRKMRRWYQGGAEMDEEVKRRFGDDVRNALEGRLDGWLSEPKGWLAVIILLDQLTRNVLRDSPRMYDGDERAQTLALDALDTGQALALTHEERNFTIMPLVHSELLAHQERGVVEVARLVEEAPDALRPVFAMGIEQTRKYRDIIARFGRFPHRNAILGRTPTADEVDFLLDWDKKRAPSDAQKLMG